MSEGRNIDREVEGLWRTVFGEAPQSGVAPGVLLDSLIGKLPVETYTTLRRHGVVLPPESR